MSAEKAKIIRQELKQELNLNRTKVSVRAPHYGCINVTIKDMDVCIDQVEAIANKQQYYTRCEVTQEILSGGNMFVFVDYDRSLGMKWCRFDSKWVKPHELTKEEQFNLER